MIKTNQEKYIIKTSTFFLLQPKRVLDKR